MPLTLEKTSRQEKGRCVTVVATHVGEVSDTGILEARVILLHLEAVDISPQCDGLNLLLRLKVLSTLNVNY